MLAPSDTTYTPFLTRLAASFPLISFCVALGKAQWALWFHSGLIAVGIDGEVLSRLVLVRVLFGYGRGERSSVV